MDPVSQVDLDRLFAAWKPVLELWVAGMRRLAAALASDVEAFAAQRAAAERRARISRNWSDPLARWAMWNRKSDRGSKQWTSKQV